ncbi:hypothetical protein [Telluribacter sp. SYSU D00476]|uniref:hypothetical protein n=1 Tax=Telluribacter sp. SYSU D00476 TaxID=2811430 RepID=UPI001FF3625C|nr:hypothetical protein [Telluribacter sp. SYSU D00476]
MEKFDESFTLAQELVEYFTEKKPITLYFPLSNEHLGTLAVQICNEDYYHMAQLFGTQFVKEVLLYLEESEDYERCSMILKQLRTMGEHTNLRCAL